MLCSNRTLISFYATLTVCSATLADGITDGGFEDRPPTEVNWYFSDCKSQPDPKIICCPVDNPTASYLEMVSLDAPDTNDVTVRWNPLLQFTEVGKFATVQFDARCFGCNAPPLNSDGDDAQAWVAFPFIGVSRMQIPPTRNWTTYRVSVCITSPNDLPLAFGVLGGNQIGLPGEPPPGTFESTLQIDNVCCYLTYTDLTSPELVMTSDPAPGLPPCNNTEPFAPIAMFTGNGDPRAQPVCQQNECACPDVTCDGVVNVLDLVDLLLCFGMPADPGCVAEDVNCDGTVNVLDMIDLLLEFEMTADCCCSF